MVFDYTTQGRRPSAKQIVADWKKAGRSPEFQAIYGEAYAEFLRTSRDIFGTPACWWIGSGCPGVQRDEVIKQLNEFEAKDTR